MTKEVVILSPIGRNEPRWTKCLADMICYTYRKSGVFVSEMGITEDVERDWARNALAREAVARICPFTGEHYTHALWLDADHVFEPDLLVRLAAHDVDLVGALYYHRNGPPLPVAYVEAPEIEDPYKHHPMLDVPNALFEVGAIGFGAVLMNLDILRNVPEPWFTIDWKAGEDVAFCVKARQHGYKVYCDGSLQIGHIGARPIVREGDYLKWKADNQQKYEADRILVKIRGAENGKL